jgi:hypothetical protein
VARLRAIAGTVLDRASAGLGPDETVAVRRSLDLMRANLTAAASEPSP